MQDQTSYSWRVQNAITQHDIGWQFILEGWLCREWEYLQHECFKEDGSKATGKRWLTELIKKLWAVAWDLWEHRNGILQTQDNLVSEVREDQINAANQRLYKIAVAVLIQSEDSYLIAVPLSQLLRQSNSYKEPWLSKTQAAIKIQRRLTGRARRELARMRTMLRQWLRRPRNVG